MSKNSNVDEFDPSVLSEVGDTIFTSATTSATPTSSFSSSTLAGGVLDDGFVDPITEAIRKEILEKQRELIREHLLNEHRANPQQNPDLGSYLENDEKFKDFLKILNEDPNKIALYNNALENSDLKKKLEAVEIAGYKNVHATHSAENYRENKIKEEQEELLRRHITATQSELEEAKDKENFRKFLETLNSQAKQDLYDKALADPQFKAQYENVRKEYENKYVGGFRPMQWSAFAEDQKREQVIKNDVGEEICTLAETTHNTAPMIVYKQDGSVVTVNSYRTIDFPVKLDDDKSGTMHLSLVAQNKDGKSNNLLRFTAHYEASPPPDGVPKLKEISSPQPLKFIGEGKDAVGYIEHGGEIYTLPVTRGKYQEMMKEVAINRGQAVDVSQTIDQDQYRIQGGKKSVTSQQINNPAVEKPVEAQNTEIPQPQSVSPATSINTPKQPDISQMQQPQSGISSNQVPPATPASQPQQPNISQMPQSEQGESTGIPSELVRTATGLSTAMQNLLEELNKNLKNEVDKTGLIGHAAEKILQDKEVDFVGKQAGIQALSDNILKNEDLTPDAKIQVVGAVLETVNNDTNLTGSEKAKLLEGIAATALSATNLEKDHRQKILENITDSALKLNNPDERWQAIDGITKSVIDSNINNDEKESIFVVMGNRVNASKLELPEKSQLVNDILDKAKEAGILTPEQQQLMQQNSDKVISEQQKENVIKDVQSILANPAFNTVGKAEAVKNITTDVLDSPAKPEVKGEIIENLAGSVANSNFLDTKGKAEIVKGIGEAIASHNTLPTAEKVTAIESVEKGIANSNAVLEDKKQMTIGLVDGIYNSTVEPVVKPELTKAVISGVDKSTTTLEDKKVLKDEANVAILERETQNLDKDLFPNLEQAKPDLYGATQKVADALKGVADTVLDVHPEKRDVSQEEIVQKTSNILSNVSNFVRDKVNSLRNTLEPNNNFKTAEEKRAELIENFNSKSTLEEKQNFIESNLINDKTLSKDVRLSIIDNLLQEQFQKRGEAIDNSQSKTQDVRILSGKSELRPVSKDEPDIEKAKMVIGQDKVNIKDNVKIMETLMNAKNTIQSESASVSNTKIPNNKKGQSFP